MSAQVMSIINQMRMKWEKDRNDVIRRVVTIDNMLYICEAEVVDSIVFDTNGYTATSGGLTVHVSVRIELYADSTVLVTLRDRFSSNQDELELTMSQFTRETEDMVGNFISEFIQACQDELESKC